MDVGLNELGAQFENLMEPLIALLLPEQAGMISLARETIKISGTFHDYCLCRKLVKFVNALREENLQDSIKFSCLLFSDEKNGRENALRLIQYIDKAENLSVVDYMVNASRAAGNQLISAADYYRIVWALTNTLSEDLHYFKTIATDSGVLKGNTQIIALSRSGLMISAGTDSNRSVEEQDYAVSSFGIMVDRYALSFGDEQRCEYWQNQDGHRKDISFKTNQAEVQGEVLMLH